jgi:phosphomannomutase
MSSITFGTDGWRAVIADAYTFENVEMVSRATAQWLRRTHPDNLSAVVGYDTRFLGAEFAALTARVLASAGIRTRLADRFVPTPAVSWATKELGFAAGIVITASHNPPRYNGFKIKSHHGAPADPDMIAAVEAELARLEAGADLRPVEDLRSEGLIEDYNLHAAYLYHLQDRLAISDIRKSGLKVGCNPMFGAGQRIVTELLGGRNVVEINDQHNPGMLGQAPEPIERNLEYFSRVVREERCDVGLAFDGDADRIGMLDEEGRFVDSHKILALLVKYLHMERGLDGTVIKTFSTTDMLDRMARSYGLPIETTKIGFKYIAPMIIEGDVLVGGEESGGIAIKGNVPERDGIMIGLTVVEMMVRSGKKLSELVDDLQSEFGPLHYARQDLHTTTERKDRFVARLASERLSHVGDETVRSVEDLDGVKLRLDDGWLMFRPSGTEPVLRIYAEASSRERAEKLVAAGAELVGSA